MFVITGLGRSGTTYVAHLLSALGVPTQHEIAFNLMTSQLSQDYGEVSWLAAPHLAALPAGTPVVRLVRDPRKVIPSWAGADHGAGGAANPHMRYAAWYCGFDYFAEGLHERALHLWHAWHALISAQVPDIVRFRLEDLADVPTVQKLLQHLGFTAPAAQITEVLATLPRDTNTYAHTIAQALPAPDSLRDALDAAAHQEGYT